MTTVPKLAIFDVDGTIATRGRVAPSIVPGIRHLRDAGCITTVSTGRGYVRMKEVLGEAFDDIVSPDALLILEHGTKIVDREGNLVFGEFFTEVEIDHVVDFTRENAALFKLLWFNPSDISKRVKVWCQNEQDVAAETEKRGHYADVFTSSLGELREILLQHRLTNITLRLKDYIKVENLKLAFTRTDTSVIFQDGNMEFIKSNFNKGLAVAYVTKQLGLSEDEILLAGNAINDVEMLDAGRGITILVSEEPVRTTILSYLSNPAQVVNVANPEALGRYLATIG